MNKIEEFFKTDRYWLETKVKTRFADTGAVLSRSEFIKSVGWKKYSPEAYREYVEFMNKKLKEIK